MKTRAFVDSNFKASSDTYSKSIRFPTNVLETAQKVAVLLKCEYVGVLINEILLAFLKGELVDATKLEALQPDNGKIQELETQIQSLKQMNTDLHTQNSLYQKEIEDLQRYLPQKNEVYTPAAHTQNQAYTPLHTDVHTSEHTPNTGRVQEPILAAHTPILGFAHTTTQGVHTEQQPECDTKDSYLKKIQELETEIDKVLEEKDTLQHKMEQDTTTAAAYQYSIGKTFDYLCQEIEKRYNIPIKPQSMHDILNHYMTEYNEQHEISID